MSFADPTPLDFSTYITNINDPNYNTSRGVIYCENNGNYSECNINGNAASILPDWWPGYTTPSPSGGLVYFYGSQVAIMFPQTNPPKSISFDVPNVFLGSECVYRYPSRVSATSVTTLTKSAVTIYPVSIDGQHFEFSLTDGISHVIIEMGCYAPSGSTLYSEPIGLSNAMVDYGSAIDLAVSQPQVSQPNATISQNDGLLHIKPGTPMTVNVPVSGQGIDPTDARTVTISLKAGSQDIPPKFVSLARIRADGTTTVPFDITFKPDEAGVQTITATVNPDKVISESYLMNNQASVQVWVQGSSKLVSQITNGGNSGTSEEKSISGSTPINAQYPLGSEFTLQLQRLGTDGVTYQAVPATYQLASATISPPADPDSLFGDLAVIGYGGANVTPTSNSVTFQTIHLGQVPLQIIPSDGSPMVTVNITVIKPDALGETHNEVDDLLIYEANQYGIPPDYLKGQVQHEGTFNPTSYRYEPIGRISDLRSFSSQKVNASGIKISDSRGLDPFEHFLFETIDGVFPQGDQLSTADILPRLKLSMTTDPLWSPSSTSAPVTRNIDLSDQFVSVRQIYFANDSKQNWSKHAPIMLVIDINDHPEILDFTAQTAVAASYGLMQVMYSTAIKAMNWQGRTSDEAKNPTYLFDTPDNLNDGGGSVEIGTGYDASLFFQVNDPQVIDPEHPNFSSASDFDTAYMRMFTCYNNCDGPKVSASQYGSEVLQYAADYFEPITNKPIFP